MYKIAASSQAFGYGPSSKVVTFIKNLNIAKPNEYEVDFYGTDISLTYAKQNSEHFNQVFDFLQPKNNDYDIVISAMEPSLIFWAVLNHKKSIYIDSLYWFWKWDDDKFTELQQIASKIREADTIENVNQIIRDVDPHSMQYLAHLLASKSLVQIFPGTVESSAKDKYRSNLKIHRIGYLIDTSLKREGLERTKILISLSGLLSPLNRIVDAIQYYDFVMDLISETIDRLPKEIDVHLTVNPTILKRISKRSDRIKIDSLDHDLFMELLNESLVTVAPAGITTILESLTYDTPIMFIPEQHDGHYENYQRLCTDNAEGKAKDIFPELLFNTRISRVVDGDPDGELQKIQLLIEESRKNPNSEIVKSMKFTFQQSILTMLDKNTRNTILELQKKTIMNEGRILSPSRTSEIVLETINAGGKI